MPGSTLEQLKALRALNPARVAALRAADRAMSEEYAGRHLAYTDSWTGDELAREIVFATPDPDEFYRWLGALEPEARRRVEIARIPDAGVLEVGSLRFECPPPAGAGVVDVALLSLADVHPVFSLGPDGAYMYFTGR